MKRMPFFSFLFTVLTLAAIGCGGGSEPPAETGAGAASATAAPVKESAAPAKPAVPESADAALMAVIQGIQNNKVDVVWDALPASYQKDVNGLIQEFAAQSDPELWGRTFGTLKKVVNILKSKKDFILGSPAFQKPGTNTEELAANWDQGVGFLETIVTSEIADINKVKSLDVGEFLSGTGNNVLKQFRALLALSPNPRNPFDRLALTKATLVKSEGDSATVKVIVPGQPPQEREFVRVEGKWVPKDVADDWDKSIADAKAQLASVPPEVKEQQKRMVVGMLDSIDGTLDQLAAAKTQEQFNIEFQQGMQQMIGPILALGSMFNAGPGGAMAGPSRPGSSGTGGPSLGAPNANSGQGAQVVIKGDYLSRLNEINSTLKEAVSEASEINPIPGDGMITFGISSVPDVQALADQLKFGKVTVDAEKRTITIEVSAP